jgi:hypothetical protein
MGRGLVAVRGADVNVEGADVGWIADRPALPVDRAVDDSALGRMPSDWAFDDLDLVAAVRLLLVVALVASAMFCLIFLPES